MSKDHLSIDLFEAVATSQALTADEIEQLATSQDITTPEITSMIARMREQSQDARAIAAALRARLSA